MFYETTGLTEKSGLGLTILRRDVIASRASLAGVLRRNRNDPATGPLLLVLELPAELVPALVEDRFVQSRLCSNISTGSLFSARSRSRHVLCLQVLDDNDRVVFADLRRELVQEVAASISDVVV